MIGSNKERKLRSISPGSDNVGECFVFSAHFPSAFNNPIAGLVSYTPVYLSEALKCDASFLEIESGFNSCPWR